MGELEVTVQFNDLEYERQLDTTLEVCLGKRPLQADENCPNPETINVRPNNVGYKNLMSHWPYSFLTAMRSPFIL